MAVGRSWYSAVVLPASLLVHTCTLVTWVCPVWEGETVQWLWCLCVGTPLCLAGVGPGRPSQERGALRLVVAMATASITPRSLCFIQVGWCWGRSRQFCATPGFGTSLAPEPREGSPRAPAPLLGGLLVRVGATPAVLVRLSQGTDSHRRYPLTLGGLCVLWAAQT